MVAATVCYGSPRDGSVSATSSEGSRTPPASPQPPCQKRLPQQRQQQQRATAASSGSGASTAKGNKRAREHQAQHVDHKQMRMLERKRRNRESAERSRQRRIQYYKQLETDVTGLRAENTALRTEVEQLRSGGGSVAVDAAAMAEIRAQNAALQAQVERLQAELATQLQPRKRAKSPPAAASLPAVTAGAPLPPAARAKAGGAVGPAGTRSRTATAASAATHPRSSTAAAAGSAARQPASGRRRVARGVDVAHALDPIDLVGPLHSPIIKQEPHDQEPHGNDDLDVLLEDVLSMEMSGANLFPSDPTYKELELSSLENDEAVDLDLKLESAAFLAASCSKQRNHKVDLSRESSILTPMIKTLDKSAFSPQLERFDPEQPVLHSSMSAACGGPRRSRPSARGVTHPSQSITNQPQPLALP